MSATQRALLWLSLLAAVALLVVCGGGGVALLVQAIGGHGPINHDGYLADGIVCLLLAIGCERWAVWSEHRLRGTDHIVPPAGEAAITPAFAAGERARWRRHRGPVAVAALVLVFVGGTAGFAVGAIVSHSQAERSSYVQHHGIAEQGTVIFTANSTQCYRSCSSNAAIDVSYTTAGGDVRFTTVHYGDVSGLSGGDKVRVLVDPRQASYAELPGSAYVTSRVWIVLGAFAVLFAALDVSFAVSVVRARRRRR